MVLVDSSVWIEYFRTKEDHRLTDLLNKDLVYTNEVILAELIPSARYKKEFDLIEGLESLERIPLNINWEGIQLLQVLNLNNGLNKVGIPDLFITQQIIQKQILFWSLDRHFTIMNNYMNFDLFQE